MIWNKLDSIEAKLEGYFPFTPIGIVSRHINKSAVNILDLGCGKGDPMLFINRDKKYYTVGVDVYPQYINICKKKKSHDKLINSDITKLDYPQNLYDIVLGIRILEHFTQEDGAKLLDQMEKMARKQVIIVTPVEKFEQSKYDGNGYQEHKFIWKPSELRNRGYKVYLNGIKGFQKDSGDITMAEKFIGFIGHILWVSFGWLPLIFPSIAANMVAVKNI